MAPNHLKFIPYAPPPPIDAPQASGSSSEAPPRRPRGRPKGSKNKPKDASTAQLGPSATLGGPLTHLSASQPPPATSNAARSINQVQSSENSSQHFDVLSLGTARTEPETGTARTETDNMHSSANTTMHPFVPHPDSAPRDVEAQTAPSALGQNELGGPFAAVCNLDAQAAPVQTPHPSSVTRSTRADAPTAVRAAASTASHARGVIDRARAQPTMNRAAPATPSPPAPLNMSDTPPLSLITDVDNENDYNSFVNGSGLGEENDEDGDTDAPPNVPASSARVPFPEWFQTQLTALLADLKTDLESTDKQSRHYKKGNFWIRAPSIWSALKATTLKPSDLFKPDFFLWDPLNILGKNHSVQCPNCPRRLTRGGIVNRPRRVVDVDSTFWLIGYTYECQKNCERRLRCAFPFLG
ncbi:hypothetical protein C8R46DRAFT_1307963 [Mycena filopes]|nr:hypothetical protein C8R46DRAFT_1307963 [Mycena filopes]